MKLRPIRTERDHRAALEEIDRLWDAKPGSRKSELLEIWAVLVSEYERGQERKKAK